MTDRRSSNIDPLTVSGFGDEWAAFDQSKLQGTEYQQLFDAYFGIFPFDSLPPRSEGFDLGCGSGRWAAGVAPRVGILHCIDPSEQALEVARRRLAELPNVHFHLAASHSIPLADGSQDFGYSLGVLHHIPDTRAALEDCTRKLKAGAPFLLYLYYRFDNRPGWFVAVWKMSEVLRRRISRMPFRFRKAITTVFATFFYWPLARFYAVLEKVGCDVSHFPLSGYRNLSFYTMRTDALDRFGTRLEQRFTRSEVAAMMRSAGLKDIRFREAEPFWVACGRRDG